MIPRVPRLPHGAMFLANTSASDMPATVDEQADIFTLASARKAPAERVPFIAMNDGPQDHQRTACMKG